MGFQKKKKKKFLVGLERESGKWREWMRRKNNGSEFLYLLKRQGEGGGWMDGLPYSLLGYGSVREKGICVCLSRTVK